MTGRSPAERRVSLSAASLREDARSVFGAIAPDVMHCFALIALIALVALLILVLLPAVLGAARIQAVVGA
jgi:hypothetical protein